MTGRLLLSLMVLVIAGSPALAQGGLKREPLYDVVLDLDGDGKMDRAVLVIAGPGRTDFSEWTKERYGLTTDERMDLYIYLDTADAALDISRPPSFLKEDIVDLQWVLPLETNGKGSLLLMFANGWGASNQTVVTLTIVHRHGEFLVGGYTLDWERRESIGACDLNLLSGKAYLQDGLDDAPMTALKGRFKPIRLKDWSEETRPTTCDDF